MSCVLCLLSNVTVNAITQPAWRFCLEFDVNLTISPEACWFGSKVRSKKSSIKSVLNVTLEIIIMYIYHALINALSAHMIHINLNMKFYTHIEHSPTKTTHTKHHTERPTTKWRPCLVLETGFGLPYNKVRLQGSVCISVCFFTPSRKSMILSLLGGGGTFLTLTA